MVEETHPLQQELYELMRKDDTIFEFLQLGSLDGVWYWDVTQPEVEWMSPRFWTLLGYDPGEKKHLASEWQDLIDPEDLEMALKNFHAHYADPAHPYDQLVRYRHRDGSTVWVRCRGIMIRDETGKPVRMLGAHTDLTAQKRAEEELKAALGRIKTLEGILPICSFCKKIRDSEGKWTPMEEYLSHRSNAKFSHGFCAECVERNYPGFGSQQR